MSLNPEIQVLIPKDHYELLVKNSERLNTLIQELNERKANQKLLELKAINKPLELIIYLPFDRPCLTLSYHAKQEGILEIGHVKEIIDEINKNSLYKGKIYLERDFHQAYKDQVERINSIPKWIKWAFNIK